MRERLREGERGDIGWESYRRMRGGKEKTKSLDVKIEILEKHLLYNI